MTNQMLKKRIAIIEQTTTKHDSPKIIFRHIIEMDGNQTPFIASFTGKVLPDIYATEGETVEQFEARALEALTQS